MSTATFRRMFQGVALTVEDLLLLEPFQDAIPLPDGSADVLVTSHALGWRLGDELREFERVVRPGGSIIHCPGTAEVEWEEELHSTLIGPDWHYRWSRFEEADGTKRQYWKQLPG